LELAVGVTVLAAVLVIPVRDRLVAPLAAAKLA
jgi:hypothetical protein